ncbi:MAG: hypothetical protein AABY83_14505 [Pseudomonadota bacterium]
MNWTFDGSLLIAPNGRFWVARRTGIHPGGGIPGTLGCIGVLGNYTADCFSALIGQSGNFLTVT